MNRRALSQFMIGCCAAVALAAAGCGSDNGATRTSNANPTGQPAAAGADRAGTPGAATGAEAGATAGAAGTSGTSAADKDTAAKAEPITLTGCLQKGDGAVRTDYILTEVKTTRASVGTSGAAANPKSDAVGQEQMRQAEHAYRLDGDRDDLDKLVGKQVRVSGTIEKRSDLNDHNANGTVKDRDREKISDSDLAELKVASVSSIPGACGKSGPRKR